MTMPINVRTEETSDLAGNQFVPARFPIPLDIDDGRAHPGDPRPRGRAAGRAGDGAGRAAGPSAEPAAHLDVDRHLRLDAEGVDLVTSNVPGAPIPIYIAGGQIEGLFAPGPMTGAAANLTLLSYRDDLHIGSTSTPPP